MKKITAFSCATYILLAVFSSLSLYAATPIIIDLGNGWKEVKPGGETICARGEEFSFFIHPGKNNKVVVDFMGGGACWNEETCAKGSATFYDSVDELRRYAEKGFEGIYNHKDVNNPVQDWHHVIIPYCTGDIHWGDTVREYGKGEKAFKIHHKGAVNTKSVLNYLSETLKTPEQVFITGCSAGSYGSIYWTPFIKEQYPHSKIQQLGDSGAGVVTQDFAKTSFPLWNPTANAPTWIPNLDPRVVDWYSLPPRTMYTEVGKFYPDVKFSQYNTAYDSTQIFYFELMGGGGEEEWFKEMFSSMNSITTDIPNFNYYVGAGERHCILPYDYFYSVQTQGVSFRDWVAQLLDGKDMQNVTCVDCDPITR